LQSTDYVAGFAIYIALGNMNLNQYSNWILELDGEDFDLRSLAEVRARIRAVRDAYAGKLSLVSVVSLRPWWQRLLGARYNVDHFFALEWSGEFAALIFFDEKVSEYRALDKAVPVVPPEDIRRRISHREPEIALEEYMNTSRAFNALDEFLESGKRPSWIEYRYVG
jgi:hypothetical protein